MHGRIIFINALVWIDWCSYTVGRADNKAIELFEYDEQPWLAEGI